MADHQHPADDLDQEHFDRAARVIAQSLEQYGYAYYELEPDDATSYKISLVTKPNGDLAFASNFGHLYPWNPRNSGFTDPYYCAGHFVTDRHSWTAVVYSRLLNTLRPLLVS